MEDVRSRRTFTVRCQRTAMFSVRLLIRFDVIAKRAGPFVHVRRTWDVLASNTWSAVDVLVLCLKSTVRLSEWDYRRVRFSVRRRTINTVISRNDVLFYTTFRLYGWSTQTRFCSENIRGMLTRPAMPIKAKYAKPRPRPSSSATKGSRKTK